MEYYINNQDEITKEDMRTVCANLVSGIEPHKDNKNIHTKKLIELGKGQTLSVTLDFAEIIAVNDLDAKEKVNDALNRITNLDIEMDKSRHWALEFLLDADFHEPKAV
jgi:hypothetical protein